MAKFKKFISIIALTVFTLTFLVGCGLFVLNEDRYRDQTALTVGQETVTLGEVIDYFDAKGMVYVQQGYSYQQVWDMLFPVFVQQKVMLNEYKTTNTASNNSALATQIGGNAAYLDDETLSFIQKSVYLSFYTSLDSLTMSELQEEFTFEDETNDEYPEMIEHEKGYTPADADSYLDMEHLDKDLEEYVSGQDYQSIKYVFDANDAKVQEIVDDLNARLVRDNDEDVDVTVADYIKAQNSAVSTITKNIKNNKKLSVEEYIAKTIREQVDAQIANAYLAKICYQENIQGKISQQDFEARYLAKVAEATAKYDQDPTSFASFVTGLTANDFVYYVPQQYAGEYHYVRSILLPFSDEQTKLLNLAKTRFGANSKQYKDYRDAMAQEITVSDNEGNEGISLQTVVDEIDVNDRDSFISATYKYNTDTGMQNPVHSYVVGKNPTDLGYAGTSFVKEFVDAARQMIAANQQLTACVTDYGIHIIWNDGEVVADDINWDDRDDYGIEGGSASWRFYQDIYEELKNLFADKQITALYNSYLEQNKIVFESDVISSYTETVGVVFED